MSTLLVVIILKDDSIFFLFVYMFVCFLGLFKCNTPNWERKFVFN